MAYNGGGPRIGGDDGVWMRWRVGLEAACEDMAPLSGGWPDVMEGEGPMRRRWRWWVVTLVVVVVLLGGFAWGASQPWTANHFGYALAGQDGLPAYVFLNGRRYHSAQVCAGADWCQADREIQNIPRCYTQVDLSDRGAWPLETAGTMFTLFGAQRALLVPTGRRGLTTTIIIADGPNCYVQYGLEGGPKGQRASGP